MSSTQLLDQYLANNFVTHLEDDPPGAGRRYDFRRYMSSEDVGPSDPPGPAGASTADRASNGARARAAVPAPQRRPGSLPSSKTMTSSERVHGMSVTERLQILASGRTRPRPDPTVDRASRRAAALARLKQRTVGSRGPAGSSNAADSARPSRSPFRPLSDNVPEYDDVSWPDRAAHMTRPNAPPSSFTTSLTTTATASRPSSVLARRDGVTTAASATAGATVVSSSKVFHPPAPGPRNAVDVRRAGGALSGTAALAPRGRMARERLDRVAADASTLMRGAPHQGDFHDAIDARLVARGIPRPLSAVRSAAEAAMRGDAEVLGDRGRPGTTRAAASVRAASTRGGPWQAEGSGDGGVAPRGASFWDAVRAEALDARGMHSVLDLIADEARRAGAEARAVGAGARREPAWEPPASEAWGRAPEGLGGAGHAGRDVERDRLMPLAARRADGASSEDGEGVTPRLARMRRRVGRKMLAMDKAMLALPHDDSLSEPEPDIRSRGLLMSAQPPVPPPPRALLSAADGRVAGAETVRPPSSRLPEHVATWPPPPATPDPNQLPMPTLAHAPDSPDVGTRRMASVTGDPRALDGASDAGSDLEARTVTLLSPHGLLHPSPRAMRLLAAPGVTGRTRAALASSRALRRSAPAHPGSLTAAERAQLRRALGLGSASPSDDSMDGDDDSSDGDAMVETVGVEASTSMAWPSTASASGAPAPEPSAPPMASLGRGGDWAGGRGGEGAGVEDRGPLPRAGGSTVAEELRARTRAVAERVRRALQTGTKAEADSPGSLTASPHSRALPSHQKWQPVPSPSPAPPTDAARSIHRVNGAQGSDDVPAPSAPPLPQRDARDLHTTHTFALAQRPSPADPEPRPRAPAAPPSPPLSSPPGRPSPTRIHRGCQSPPLSSPPRRRPLDSKRALDFTPTPASTAASTPAPAPAPRTPSSPLAALTDRLGLTTGDASVPGAGCIIVPDYTPAARMVSTSSHGTGSHGTGAEGGDSLARNHAGAWSASGSVSLSIGAARATGAGAEADTSPEPSQVPSPDSLTTPSTETPGPRPSVQSTPAPTSAARSPATPGSGASSASVRELVAQAQSLMRKCDDVLQRAR